MLDPADLVGRLRAAGVPDGATLALVIAPGVGAAIAPIAAPVASVPEPEVGVGRAIEVAGDLVAIASTVDEVERALAPRWAMWSPGRSAGAAGRPFYLRQPSSRFCGRDHRRGSPRPSSQRAISWRRREDCLPALPSSFPPTSGLASSSG